MAGRLFDTSMAPGSVIYEWMGRHRGNAAQTVCCSPWACAGRARGPEFPRPGNIGGPSSLWCCGSVFQTIFLPNVVSSVCSPPVIVYHPSLKPQHTHGIWRAKAATPRALAKMQVLFSASLGLLLAKPSFTLPALLQVASAWFRGEEGHLCIWAWGGMTGRNCWRGHSCSLPPTLVQGRQARWGAAGEAGGEEPPGTLWTGNLGWTEWAEAQKGRNRSHLLWTWENNGHDSDISNVGGCCSYPLTFLEARGPCQTQPDLVISCQPSTVGPGPLPTTKWRIV